MVIAVITNLGGGENTVMMNNIQMVCYSHISIAYNVDQLIKIRSCIFLIYGGNVRFLKPAKLVSNKNKVGNHC